jgi:Ca-activated chloride channel family protein
MNTLHELRFAEPAWLLLAMLAIASVILGLWADRRRAVRLRAFVGDGAARAEGARWSRTVRVVREASIAAALVAIAVALARPQANPREEKTSVVGRDVVFLVDVSRSMLAQDVKPSRLARTKLWIKDLAATLDGDRVGLVAFAGASSIRCPLTLDYGFFTLALDELNSRSVPRGGTLIGDAIRKTLTDVFEDKVGRNRDIILITDGEDHESFPVEAARRAAELGVRIIAIGIGSEQGAAVPEGDEAASAGFVEADGQRVQSRMDSGTLADVARASAGGVFLNVGTGNVELERVYADLVRAGERTEQGVRAVVRYSEYFQVCLAAAIALLALEACVHARIRL